MATYLVQVSYTSDAWASLIDKPEDRSKVVAALAKSMGGKLVGFWYSFGEYDATCIVEAPDSVSAAALLIAVGAAGSVKWSKTTVLLSAAEAVEAMKQASGAKYKPVGG